MFIYEKEMNYIAIFKAHEIDLLPTYLKKNTGNNDYLIEIDIQRKRYLQNLNNRCLCLK